MKSSNTLLMFVFFALLGLFIAKKTLFKPQKRSFRTTLTNIDENGIDRFTIQSGSQNPLIELIKNDHQWTVKQGTLSAIADSAIVANTLQQLAHIKTTQLVSKSKDEWTKYELNDNTAKIAALYQGSKLQAKVLIGKFNYNPNTRTGVSYARLPQEEDVYALQGFLSASLPKDFNSFRKTDLIAISSDNIKQLDVTINGKHWSLSHNNKKWSGNTRIDSVKMDYYVKKISHLKARNFAQTNDPSLTSPLAELKISSTDDANPFTIKAYQNPEKSNEFIIKSNQNDAYFTSDSTGVFKTLFLDWDGVVGS